MGLSAELWSTVEARVQRVDPARTLAARLAPPLEARRLLSLYAFQYEIARVAEQVSEPMLGEIRLQWWREAVEEIRAKKAVRAHDAASALDEAYQAANAPDLGELLTGLIDARERDLDPEPLPSMDAIYGYADATAGGLVLCAARLLLPEKPSEKIEIGLRAAGRAWGLAGLARETALAKQFNAKPRIRVEVSPENIRTAALAAHGLAKRNLSGAPAWLLPAYAYVALVPSLTRRFTPNAMSPLGMRWRIFRTALTGRL